MKVRQGQMIGLLPTLECAQTLPGGVSKSAKIQTESLAIAVVQAPKAFTQQHGGATVIAPLQMEMGYGDLKDALQASPAWAMGLMPELFEAVVTGIPLAGVELGHGGDEAWIGLNGGLLRIRWTVRGRSSGRHRRERGAATLLMDGGRRIADGLLRHPSGQVDGTAGRPEPAAAGQVLSSCEPEPGDPATALSGFSISAWPAS